MLARARLALQAATMLRLDAEARILGEAPPDGGPGPRLYAVGDGAGMQAWVHRDLPPGRASAAMRIAAAAPPWTDPDRLPDAASELAALIGGERSASLVFALQVAPRPHAPHETVILSGAPAGDALLDRRVRQGVPAHLLEAGFAGPDDFWAPSAAALEDGGIAALAFAARLAGRSAEVGVYTFPAWRGRGFAGRVVRAWAAHPDLAGRELFYSCAADNAASRRVAAGLGLIFLGCGLRIG